MGDKDKRKLCPAGQKASPMIERARNQADSSSWGRKKSRKIIAATVGGH
ncbi:MAG: hypothetical protein QXH91_05005 [Candidatus Bathyarchaeia archaeon]